MASNNLTTSKLIGKSFALTLALDRFQRDGNRIVRYKGIKGNTRIQSNSGKLGDCEDCIPKSEAP